ncbi:MAG: hypothetical protein L6Q29_04585 [Candidatus Pacebacteria bacterium]|nr:hypothetical protein [Candidatus Paceibacterota bacterium]
MQRAEFMKGEIRITNGKGEKAVFTVKGSQVVIEMTNGDGNKVSMALDRLSTKKLKNFFSK